MEAIYNFFGDLAIWFNLYANPIVALMILIFLFFTHKWDSLDTVTKLAASLCVIGLFGSMQSTYMITTTPGVTAFDYPFWIFGDISVTVFLGGILYKHFKK